MKYFLIIVIVISVMLSGCQVLDSRESKLERLDSIIASEPGCSAPCWNSLIPGTSNEKDFLDLVNVSDPQMFEDLRSTALTPEGLEYLWKDDTNDLYTRIRIHEDEIKLIGFQWLNNSFSLSLITELYGFPSVYGASMLIGHEAFLLLSLIYEEDGVVVEVWIPFDEELIRTIEKTCEYTIDWDASIRKANTFLVEPGSAKEMVKNNAIGGFTNPSHVPQSWKSDNPIQLTDCP